MRSPAQCPYRPRGFLDNQLGTTLNWTAATVGANCSVTSYTIYQNGTSIGTASSTTFNVTNLTPSTTYSFTVGYPLLALLPRVRRLCPSQRPRPDTYQQGRNSLPHADHCWFDSVAKGSECPDHSGGADSLGFFAY